MKHIRTIYCLLIFAILFIFIKDYKVPLAVLEAMYLIRKFILTFNIISKL